MKHLISQRDWLRGALVLIAAAGCHRDATPVPTGTKAPSGTSIQPIAAGEDLDKKVIAVEERLFNITATGRGQDFLRMPSQLMEKLAHLADTLQLADFAPTDQQLEVHKLLTDQVNAAAGDLNNVVSKDVATFNDMLRRRNIGTVIVRD